MTKSPLTALVVDDDANWRRLVDELLSEAGWQVQTAVAPPPELNGYGLLVVDLSLNASVTAGREGMEVLKRLKGTDKRCVILSGEDDAELRSELERHGGVLAVLHKNAFDREAFLELARRVAAGRRRVLIVEDEARWRAIYEDILTSEGYVTQWAASYGEARGWLQRSAFALAIVDLNLASSMAPQDNRDGFWLLRAARQQGIPTVVVSALGAPEDVDRAYDEYGVFAFVEKEGFDRHSFARIVAEAVRSTTAAPATKALSDEARLLSTLTDREREVLELLAQGYTNRQIGETLMITTNTVKKHVDHILQKLEVSNRAAAVAVALRAKGG